MSLRSELRECFKEYTFKTYRCTGTNCTFEMVAVEGIEIWCNTPYCRGIVTPRRIFPTSKMITATLEEIFGHYPEPKPPFQSRFHGVSSSQKAQKLLDVFVGATMKVNASMRIAQMDVNRPKDYQRIDGKTKND
ncbi:MAG: hypothetical protein O2943_04835 [Actinomycetota bacterium]|nr:hypothetical protein [Actinomycetota bacterium]